MVFKLNVHAPGAAVAANFEPEVLIIDEVLAVGIRSFKKNTDKNGRNIRSRSHRNSFVSHNMRAIETLCNRVLWLVEGQVVEKEKTEKVVSDYVNTRSVLFRPRKCGTMCLQRQVTTRLGSTLRNYDVPLSRFPKRSAWSRRSNYSLEFWNYEEKLGWRFIIHVMTAEGVHALPQLRR